MISVGSQTGLYVYGVLPAGVDAALFAPTAGVDGTPVELVTAARLAAIVSRVPLHEFGEEPLRRNLEDREWLEKTVRAHDGVLAPAVGRVALVPLRFGAVYRSEDGVRDLLEQRSEELHAALERFRGRIELGVKAFLSERDRSRDARGAPATGRDYLVQKQRALTLDSDVDAARREAVGAVHEELASLADEARANPPQHPELTGRPERMALNGAYLVPVERLASFVGAVAAFERARQSEGVTLELTGPWPPYNFVALNGAR